MNKKRYVTPDVYVMTVNTTEIICQSVMGAGAANDIRWGGKGIDGNNNHIEAGSREGRFWDEEY